MPHTAGCRLKRRSLSKLRRHRLISASGWRQAVIAGDVEVVTSLVETALAEGLTPLEISNEGLLPGLEEVGRRFEKNQLFLPQVMRSAETMQTRFSRLKAELNGLG